MTKVSAMIGALALVGCAGAQLRPGAASACELPPGTGRVEADAIACGWLVWERALGPGARCPEIAEVALLPDGLPGDRTEGRWNPDARRMTFVVSRLPSAQAWCRIAAHELGHALVSGPREPVHVSSPALMAATPAGLCLTSNDLEWCDAHGLECRATCVRAEF